MSASAAHKVQVAIVGAGVIGLACAKSLARRGKEVVIVERASAFGTGKKFLTIHEFLTKRNKLDLMQTIYRHAGTSSRNSEVIHAGIYYAPGTNKARFCFRGKHMLYDYCKSRSIPHKRIGKLIVATSQDQLLLDLPRIQKRALVNGVNDLRQLSIHDVAFLEPQVKCLGGLFSPSTGIVDSHALMLSLLADAEQDGATLALESTLENAKQGTVKGGIILTVNGMDLLCDMVVNCAGLYAGIVNQMIVSAHEQRSSSNRITRQIKRQYFAKGNYFKLQSQNTPFSHLIYPVPEVGGLGVHATLDLSGGCRFGPDVEWLNVSIDNPDEIDLSVNSNRLDPFYQAIRSYWHDLHNDALVADYTGIRPKLGHPSLLPNGGLPLDSDFVIEGPTHHGIHGYINLCGIESPGLTASMAIAEHVSSLIEE